MTPLRLLVILSSIIASSYACSDLDNILSPETSDLGLTQSATDSEIFDLEVLPQFDVQLNGTGQLKPGTIHLNATITGNLEAPSFEFRVTVPDLEITRVNNWTAQREWLEHSVPPVVAEHRSVGHGQSLIEPVVLQIPVSGYYRVIVTATADPPVGAHDQVVQNGVEEDFWLWVSNEGGSLESEFDESRFPSGFLKRPGPLTPIPERSLPRRGLAPAGFSSTVFQVRYINADSSNALTPVPGARVVYTIFDQFENRVVGQGEFSTNSSGNFTADCPHESGWDTHTYQVYAENADVAVLPGSAIWSATLYPNDPYCQNTTNLADVGAWAARAFTSMQVIIPASRSLLGVNKGKTGVIQVSGTTAGYDIANDRLKIPSGTIWSGAALFTLAHEYGHAVNQKALGGLNPNYSLNCNPHAVATGSSYGCALSEGFADFHAVRIWGSRSQYYSDIVSVQFVNPGPNVEGAVAAFFYDLVDGTGTPGEGTESHDTIQYPGTYLADIIRTCKYNGSSRASGIDHIVYCFERSLSSRSGHHWADRAAVSSFSEGATEPSGWSQTAIFSNWHWNIYRH